MLEVFIPPAEVRGEPRSDGVDGSPASIPGALRVHPSFFESFLDVEHYYPNYKVAEHGCLLEHGQLRAAVAALQWPDCVEPVVADDGADEATPGTYLVYGRGDIEMMSSCRVAWALVCAGAPGVAVLDGGFHAWQRWLSRKAPAMAPADLDVHTTDASGSLPSIANALASTADALAIAETGALPSGKRALLVDVRRKGEHETAHDSRYGFFSSAGHIPGSVWMGNWDVMLDRDGCLGGSANAARVCALWRSLGLVAGEGDSEHGCTAGADASSTDDGCSQLELVFYCGTGWRSCVAWVIAQSLGLPARNLDGGLFAWKEAGNEVDFGAGQGDGAVKHKLHADAST